MNKIQELKLDGLAKKKHLEEFVQSFTPDMATYISKDEPVRSGLEAFLTANLLEHQNEFEKALARYQQGVDEFVDPLCAYRLAEVYSNKNNPFKVAVDKKKAYYYWIMNCHLDLVYSVNFQELNVINCLVGELDPQYEWMGQLIKESSSLEGLEALIVPLLKYQLGDSSYYSLVHCTIQLITGSNRNVQLQLIGLSLLMSLIVSRASTNDKMIDSILPLFENLNLLQPLLLLVQQISKNFEVFRFLRGDTQYFERQRELFFEIVFIIRSIMKISMDRKKFDKIPDFIKISNTCGQLWGLITSCANTLYDIIDLFEKLIHKALVLRLYADLISKGNPFTNTKTDYPIGYEIQQMELRLKKPTQYGYAITHYLLMKLAKNCGMIQESKRHLEKAYKLYRERVELAEDKFTLSLSNYYLSRLEFVKLNLYDERFRLEECVRLLTGHDALKMVRTIQYHIIVRKSRKRLQEIMKEVEIEEAKIEEQRLEYISYLEMSRKQVWQTQSYICQSLQKSVGPMVASKLEKSSKHPETAIHLYASQIHFTDRNSLERRELKLHQNDGLNFVKAEDIDYRQLVQKGELDGGVYMIVIQGIQYRMKYMVTISRKLVDNLLELFKYYQSFSHPCLRKILAYLIEPVGTHTLNIGLVYEPTQFNLFYLESQGVELLFIQKLQLAHDIVGAVNYLHQQKHYHGNLKPQNVLIRLLGGQIYSIVSDWEMCREIYPMIHDELSSQFGWSAPEVYSQKVKASLTADFWSVGALLLYIFYGVNLQKTESPYAELVLPFRSQSTIIDDIVLGLCKLVPSERCTLDEVQAKLVSLQ